MNRKSHPLVKKKDPERSLQAAGKRISRGGPSPDSGISNQQQGGMNGKRGAFSRLIEARGGSRGEAREGDPCGDHKRAHRPGRKIAKGGAMKTRGRKRKEGCFFSISILKKSARTNPLRTAATILCKGGRQGKDRKKPLVAYRKGQSRKKPYRPERREGAQTARPGALGGNRKDGNSAAFTNRLRSCEKPKRLPLRDEKPRRVKRSDS